MQEFRKFPKKPESVPRPHAYEFGTFTLNPLKRIVLSGHEPIPLTPKCFDILLALLEHRDEVLVKEELMELVWPDTAVEEGNLNRHVSTIRKALGESPNDHRFIVTVPGRGYRFVAEVREVLEENSTITRHESRGGTEGVEIGPDVPGKKAVVHPISVNAPLIVRPALGVPQSFLRKYLVWAGAGVLACLLGLLLTYRFVLRPKRILGANDRVLIADFSNATGDVVFDDTLKQAVSVDLSQSPYLNILSDTKVSATLKLMTKPPDTRVTGDVARDLCQRAGCKAYITGSIARLDTQYVIGLNAVDCESGDSIARQQVKAQSKDRVLNALDEAASTLRRKLGESLNTVRAYDTPLMDATTPSLDALKAYTVGLQKDKSNDAAAVPFFRRAIELDPEFASAYSGLAACYFNLGESGLARENFTKAFELRNHVSEREKLLITARYYDHVTGELPKAIEAYQLWTQAYPRDAVARGNLGTLYAASGQFEKSIPETQEALRLEPDSGTNYSNLLLTQAALDHFDDARATFNQEMAKKIEDPILRVNWFGVAFVLGEVAEMDKQMAWSAAKPQAEDNFLAAKSDAESYYGHAQWKMDGAIHEAEFGNPQAAREETAAARALTSSHDTEILAALVFARTGDITNAEKLAKDLEKQYPLDTLVNNYWLPVIRASEEIARNNPTRAIQLLQPSAPYELASPVAWSGLGGPMYPAYLRGAAFLQLRQGNDAAPEYQKIIDHRGFMLACPLGALAQLGMARAFRLQGDQAKARSSYQKFLVLWKDADPDIPILTAAKSEYAKL